MLQRVDRVQLAVRDRQEAARTFAAVLGARQGREDRLSIYNATRTVVQAGQSEFELLQPDGDGPVAEHIDRWGEGIFAAGFSTADLPALATQLDSSGIRFTDEGGQLFIAPDQTRGMRAVISGEQDVDASALITHLYEVTNIVADHEDAAAFYARIFGLDSSRFCPIKSERWGYVGTLTLYNPPAQLDRIELTQTTEQSLAMGRFYARRGESIYMCFAETENIRPIAEGLKARGARYMADEDFVGSMFIHPSALCGMLMGISRTNEAWKWSGRPELATA
ncbi:MAG TPA: VOC family protein [Dehalococcoidia bacterium]|nr:VOC family protein [Dehalococcoidia bacterium]